MFRADPANGTKPHILVGTKLPHQTSNVQGILHIDRTMNLQFSILTSLSRGGQDSTSMSVIDFPFESFGSEWLLMMGTAEVNKSVQLKPHAKKWAKST